MMGKGNLEIERKFEIAYPTDGLLAKLLSVCGAFSAELEQVYLTSSGDTSVRVRRIDRGGERKYIKTEKHGVGIVRQELENEITEAEYKELLLSADNALLPVVKKRISVPSDGKLLEIDLYDGFREYAVCEVELDSPDDELPSFMGLEVIKEVTGEKRWLNCEIARHGMPEK